ncbi:MAG TPA: maltose alpha-D-glucosyltransferase [Candidatus Baltobacteraceae bacterium]|nr:maltose alpha-D-glucosyltransferase [Candidatus Baltobacteraceae bacterium]
MDDAADPLWFKDAVIYQIHVKSFFDADDDGIGDFKGLTAKLDYIRALGANCIWLLPFYPSPLRDDGYDIADYVDVNPAYGTMDDFREFVRRAHERGIRVITELVVNHTSDKHPWFERARRAPKGSPEREFYVWSDDDAKFAGARIIFTDTETSNWSWDAVAGQYYWHRFFSHQPDLNYQNPLVLAAVLDVMRFWLDAGVDGLRLDAVPYLYEREGTTSENLPETHAVLKVMRAVVDAEYPGRVFLAEANQWPEDVAQYFGEGDECHMAFHFPLMPRMFMSIAEEDRYPIVDIMRQTPEIPSNCQWAIFLRNHDEMTLEMVTETERETMYRVYATEPRARINIGIRRRLAPLMENDRRRIELMVGLLLSMPGTPILYYGDEIGMGDNIYANDRDGVRTPMQWSMDRNGGFSRANPARLFLPPIMDVVYGYQSVNVEAQSAVPGSLINWMRKLIAVRQGYKVFGRGTLAFVNPQNRKVLAYVREHDGETVLCVANLSRAPQQAALDLSAYSGRVPVEMIGWSPFGTITEEKYVVTLPGHGFFWFLLSETAQAPAWESTEPGRLPELLTLVLPRTVGDSRLGSSAVALLEGEVLPAYLPQQRWFADKGAAPGRIALLDAARLGDGEAPGDPERAYAAIFELPEIERAYFIPLTIDDDVPPEERAQMTRATMARVRRGPRDGLLFDGFATDEFVLRFLEDVRGERRREGYRGGTFAGHATDALRALPLGERPAVRRMNVEQSNTSVVVDDRIMLKGYRRTHAGPQPELEVARFLDAVGYRNTPALYGYVEYERDDRAPMAIAILQAFVSTQGDGWNTTLAYLERFFDRRRTLEAPQQLVAPAVPGIENPVDVDEHAIFLSRIRTLGVRTAELHRAFATPTGDPAFEPQPTMREDLEAWAEQARATAERALDALAREAARIPPDLRAGADALLARRDEILARVAPPAVDARVTKTRFHGDYHLGQVLVLADDFMIVDFEGEPARPPEARRRKSSPLRDVAGMLRSFNYAAVAGVRGLAQDRGEDTSGLEPLARDWERRTVAAFLEGYRETIAGCSSYPDDPAQAQALLDLFVLEKAFYEMSYELANRPAWLRIPMEGIRAILDADARED